MKTLHHHSLHVAVAILLPTFLVKKTIRGNWLFLICFVFFRMIWSFYEQANRFSQHHSGHYLSALKGNTSHSFRALLPTKFKVDDLMCLSHLVMCIYLFSFTLRPSSLSLRECCWITTCIHHLLLSPSFSCSPPPQTPLHWPSSWHHG